MLMFILASIKEIEMGLSKEFLDMIWDEVERNGLFDCEAYAIRNALMAFPGI